MKMGSMKYLVGEGFKNTWVNRLMSLASVGVLVACMVIIGLALLVSENVNKAIGKLEQQNVVMVYMKDYNWALYSDKTEDTSSEAASSEAVSDAAPAAEGETPAAEGETPAEEAQPVEEPDANGIRSSDYVIHDEAQAKALCAKIEELPNVATAEFVSSEAGLDAVKQSMLEGQEQYFTFLNDEYGNPMSCAAKVTMTDMEQFDATVESIRTMEGVDVIQSQGDLANKITAIKKGVAVAGFWIIAILMVISLVIVSNTIRVTMYNRKLEISIMKAVGATDSFVRIPFVVEGMLIGVISALLAEGLLYFCYRVATETIIATLNTTDIVRYGDMAGWLLLIFIGIGVLAGALGSFIMIGKYLRREGSEFAAI